MTAKSLAVFGLDGAGKKTLVGSLIYKCGLELPELERLEKNGITKMAEIVAFYKKEGLDQSFYAPSAQFVVEETLTPSTAIWLVDVTDSDHGKASSEGLSDLISSGPLKPKDKLLVVLNKIDLVDSQTLQKVAKVFDSVEVGTINSQIVAISAFHGDNVLESPAKTSWTDSYEGGTIPVSKQTLMEVL